MVQGATQQARESLHQELRRGAIVLAVLSALNDEEYGWSLLKALSDRGLEVDEGTLYPLLRRLESQALLSSRWRIEDGRRRRYYRVTEEGAAVRAGLLEEWRDLDLVMKELTR